MAPTAAESRLTLVAIFLPTLASTLLLKPVAANQDVDALSALRRGLQEYPNGELKNWDANLVDACTWSHITCDRDNNRVTRIDLNKMNLSGPLAPELGKLDRLQYLEIDHNRLTGPIPRELAGLSNLKHADFSNNNLCGPIPTTGAFQRIPRSRKC
ncbi:hypothetical protein CFC21_007928 [Triticum aestivum]|uniref:Leucine-rich repeat-containing N-terminal plant-type domain-containing protein n=2 Tax=Triticum aestivum TaxID=4565 RepID=A0A9R1IRX1_WHEAT|nr:hypothetical protein CFC21_007928 [Triticum aestivum]